MQKKSLTVWRNYFSIKNYSTFSAKMFKVPPFENVYYNNDILWIFYLIMVETMEKKKNGKTWRNEGHTKAVKTATSEINFSILKRNFTIL